MRLRSASSASTPPAALICCICSGDACAGGYNQSEAMQTATTHAPDSGNVVRGCGQMQGPAACSMACQGTLACFASASHALLCTIGKLPSSSRAIRVSVVAGLARLPRPCRKLLSE